MAGVLPHKKREIAIATWPTYLDVDNIAVTLPKIIELKRIGFTHAGVRVFSAGQQNAKVEQIRGTGSRIAGFETSVAAREILTDPAQLDAATHPSNSKNLKYFDGIGFDPLLCHNDVACPGGRPTTWAHDPKYTGSVWQAQLDFFGRTISSIQLVKGDFAFWDIEIWTVPTTQTGVEYDYPEAISASAGRYQGTQDQRYQQYIDAWRLRGKDFATLVKTRYPNVPNYFYAENIPEYWAYAQLSQQVGADPPARGPTWMPPGTGDVPSPVLYIMNNPTLLADFLDGGSFENTVPWISFTFDGLNRVTTTWSSSITRQCATLLKEAGVNTVIEYPGPHDPGFSAPYYYDHAQQFYEGFK